MGSIASIFYYSSGWDLSLFASNVSVVSFLTPIIFFEVKSVVPPKYVPFVQYKIFHFQEILSTPRGFEQSLSLFATLSPGLSASIFLLSPEAKWLLHRCAFNPAAVLSTLPHSGHGNPGPVRRKESTPLPWTSPRWATKLTLRLGYVFFKKKKSKIIWRKLAQMIKKHLNFFVHSGQRWYSLSSISSLWPSSGDCVCAQLLMILRQ